MEAATRTSAGSSVMPARDNGQSARSGGEFGQQRHQAQQAQAQRQPVGGMQAPSRIDGFCPARGVLVIEGKVDRLVAFRSEAEPARLAPPRGGGCPARGVPAIGQIAGADWR